MREATRQLTLVVDGGPGGDVEELADLTAQLRRRLLELDVQAVELVRSNDIPPGAKPVDAVTIGALAVTLIPPAIGAVVRLVETWLKNRPVRSAKITMDGDSLELAVTSQAQQEKLAQAFIDRHANK